MSEAPITVHNFIDAKLLGEDISYSMANISEAMQRQASLFVHYGSLAAKASRQVSNIDLLLDTTTARVYREKRDELLATGAKVTEAQMDKAVTSDSRIIKLRVALNEAVQIESQAKIAVEAFKHRRDMLIQQGLIMREEMKGELSISAKKESEMGLAAMKERAIKRISENGA